MRPWGNKLELLIRLTSPPPRLNISRFKIKIGVLIFYKHGEVEQLNTILLTQL